MSAQTKEKGDHWRRWDLLCAQRQWFPSTSDHWRMGDAGFYPSAADILADEFTAVTYDRRSNSSSTWDRAINMSVAQQAPLSRQCTTTKLLYLGVAEAPSSVSSWQRPSRRWFSHRSQASDESRYLSRTLISPWYLYKKPEGRLAGCLTRIHRLTHNITLYSLPQWSQWTGRGQYGNSSSSMNTRHSLVYLTSSQFTTTG